MAGSSVDKDSGAHRPLDIQRQAEGEQAERTPFSPVTTNVPAAGSPGKIYTHGSPFSRTTFRNACENRAAMHTSSICSASQEVAGAARGMPPIYVEASDAAGPGNRIGHRDHAWLGSVMCDGSQSEDLRCTVGPPVRAASLCSEVSFSHIAEEARKLAQSLDIQAENVATWPTKSSDDAKRLTSGSLSQLEPTSHPPAPVEHRTAMVAADSEQQFNISNIAAEVGPGRTKPLLQRQSSHQPAFAGMKASQSDQQEVHPQGTPQHSRWAMQQPDAAQLPHSIPSSGRKRPRSSTSAASSNSVDLHTADALDSQHPAPLPALSPQSQQKSTLRRRQISDDDDEGAYTPNMEGTLAVACTGHMSEVLSPGSSISDELASSPPELSRQAALVAAKAVAQVMALQARHHDDMQAMNCERVALAVEHESTLASLHKVLKENISLQGIMLNQAQQMGALGAAQEALRRQLEDKEKLQALQYKALQQRHNSTPQQHESSSKPTLLDGPAELEQEVEQEDGDQATQEPNQDAALNAQRMSQADSGSCAESTPSQPGAAQHSGDSTMPSRAASLVRATPAPYGSPAQTPLSSLFKLAHILHTPRDMAAARMLLSGPAQSSIGAHEEARVRHVDSSYGERGRWTLSDSPADSYGSRVMASPDVQSSSHRHASPGPEAAGHMAWEHSGRTLEGSNPVASRAASHNGSEPSAPGLASPTEASLCPQHAAEQGGEHISSITERNTPLFSSYGDVGGSTANAVALPCPTEAFRDPYHAAKQPWEHNSHTIEAHNPLFDRCADVSASAAHGPREHSTGVMQEHKPLCDSAEDDERSPKDLALLSAWASKGQRGQDNAQMLIRELRHELQASRDEAAQAKQASARDKQHLEMSRLESENMAEQLRSMQEWLTTLQAEPAAAQQACHVSAMPGHAEEAATAGMLRQTLQLLAAARSQIASQAHSGSRQPQTSPEAQATERIIAYLREDLEMKSEQLATAQLQMEIAQSQIQARQGLIQALNKNEVQLQAQLDEAHEATQQARQEGGVLAGQLQEAELVLASLESARAQLQAELERERGASRSLLSQSQQEGAAVDAHPEQEHAGLYFSDSSPGRTQAQLEQLGAQHAGELGHELAASQQREGSLRQKVAALTACVEEQRRVLAASAESRADLAEQQEVLAEALARREQEVGELSAASAELRRDLGILEATLRASIDSRADAHDRAEQLQQLLHEAAAELARSQASAQALAEDLLESERETMQLSTAAAQASAEESQAVVPVFDKPYAEQPSPFQDQQQAVPTTISSQALQAGSGKIVQLLLIVRQSAGSTPAEDGQACNETACSVAAAAAREPEMEHHAMQEAAEPQECQQCNEFAQQLEDCIREFESSQAEVSQLSQQLAAVQGGAECPHCAGMAQQLQACMQAAEARCLQISQQVFARDEAAQRAQRELEAVMEDRDALAARLAVHTAMLGGQAASSRHLQEHISQHDGTTMELQDAMPALQQESDQLSHRVEPCHADLSGVQVDSQSSSQAAAGQANLLQLADWQADAEVAELRSQVVKLCMELAGLGGDGEHCKARYEAGCQVLTQLQDIAAQAVGEAESLREQAAALVMAKSALSAQLAAAQGAAAAEISLLMGEAAELKGRLEQSQRTAQEATEAMQSLADELKAALMEAAKSRAREQYALRELQEQQVQQGQLPNLMQLLTLESQEESIKSLAAQAPGADPAGPATEGRGIVDAAAGQPSKLDVRHLGEPLPVLQQQVAARSSGPACIPPKQECTMPSQEASQQDSPVRSVSNGGKEASSSLHEAGALSPVSDHGSPRALDPLVAEAEAAAAATQAAALLSPVAAKHTPAAFKSVPWTQQAASQPCSSLFKALPAEASPSDRLQWPASQVAHEADAWEETVTADVGDVGRPALGSLRAALTGLTGTLATAATKEEPADQVVARLKLERHLLRGVTNLAVTVTNDVLTGSPQAAILADRAGGFMSTNQAALKKAGLDETWASLLSMAHHPPCPDATKLLLRENELQKSVMTDVEAEAGRFVSEQDLLLGQAAYDVASLCQTIYDTFPGLEQTVPSFERNPLGLCRLGPAEMLELHVSRCKSGIERLLLNLLSNVPEHLLLGSASPSCPAEEPCEFQDTPEGPLDWEMTPEGHRLRPHLQAIGLVV